ncbi:MAG: pitrilysin family protein [Thermodesulfobacteriota bacterium]|nr:pitrilysin family protein [Thermodesulfobacteriota bacterium]
MYKKTVLDNGVRVVTERIPHTRTVSVGLWVDVGARDEHDLNNGSAHFLEHMFFKGTHSRSAQVIARELDVLGGTANAFTSNEHTCFYATIMDDRLSRYMELLSDFFLNSVFSEDEVERERQVILQEISMVEDTPDERIHELFSSHLWGRHPLANTVLGSREVVGSMNTSKLVDYIERYYSPKKILIASAGNLDHKHFVDLCNKKFPGIGDDEGVSGTTRAMPTEQPPLRKVYSRPLEQVHMILGTYGLPVNSDDRYKLALLNTILGGNMSSRLFQEIREKRGLAYSIYSYLVPFADCGYVGVYMGVAPETVNEVVSLVTGEIEKLVTGSVTKEELVNAKDYIKATLFLANENTEARMTRIARNELYFDTYIAFDDVVAGVDIVTIDEIQDLSGRLLRDKAFSAAALGPLEDDDIDWSSLN